MQAKKGFGGTYECQQNWPEDTYVQCGDSGLVYGGARSYITAFFEAFPKDPKTFIRGEGESLEAAELAAFNKLLKYKACDGHVYAKMDNSEHGDCTKCGLFTSHCFPPAHQCHVCQKQNINYTIDYVDYYCREHFLEQLPNIQANYSIDDIPPYGGMTDTYENQKYTLREMLFTQCALKYNLINLELPEYAEKNRMDKVEDTFDRHCYNLFAQLYNRLNESRPENDKFSISRIMFPKIKQHIILAPELFEKIFRNHYNDENLDIDEEMTAYFYVLYERFRKKDNE